LLFELDQAKRDNLNVVLLLSFSWKSEREFNKNTVHEKKLIAEHVMGLKFNEKGQPWLVMISGDSHQVSFDDGSANIYGGFPIYQCSPLDAGPSCKIDTWSEQV
jgi:hypothetical protein